MLRILLLISLLFLSVTLQARLSGSANHLAVGQGISSPTQTSVINFSSGFTHENPVGVTYQQSLRISGQADWGGASDWLRG